VEVAERQGIRVLLADDDRAFLEALRELIDRQPELGVVGLAENGLEAIEQADDLDPDAVVIDLHMPLVDGVTAVARLRRDHPAICLIALTGDDAPKLHAAVKDAGADGVLLKSELVEGLDIMIVRELTGGKGADIVYNTVGDPYFQAAHKSLALRGRQILIAAVDRIVQFNILEFYRGQHTYVGIDTLGLSSTATGAVLRDLGPGFASGHLKPFPIKANAVYPLERAKEAYVAVAGSSRDRVILKP